MEIILLYKWKVREWNLHQFAYDIDKEDREQFAKQFWNEEYFWCCFGASVVLQFLWYCNMCTGKTKTTENGNSIECELELHPFSVIPIHAGSTTHVFTVYWNIYFQRHYEIHVNDLHCSYEKFLTHNVSCRMKPTNTTSNNWGFDAFLKDGVQLDNLIVNFCETLATTLRLISLVNYSRRRRSQYCAEWTADDIVHTCCSISQWIYAV